MSELSEKLNGIIADYLQRVASGQNADPEEYLRENADLCTELNSFFAVHHQLLAAIDGGKKIAADEHGVRPLHNVPPKTETSVVREGSRQRDTSTRDNESTPPNAGVARTHTRMAAEILPRDFGDYELLDVVAYGGMGVVYKARQRSLDRIVAVKMILAGQLADDEEVVRFRREAQAAGGLDHPSIVPVYEVGAHERQHYFSMGFVEGGSLAEQLHNGPLDAMRAARDVKHVSEAVAYAHEKGVIHRDIKPGNILVDSDGGLRITDFGLATRRDETSGVTVTGQILGTPAYMPPEQATGLPGRVGPLSDVYSIGAVLYCLITGRPPFQAVHPVETLRQVLEDEPVSPRRLNSAIPADLETICLTCLDKEPSRRYSSASALAADLGRFLDGKPIDARPVGQIEKTAKWVRRHRAVSALLATVALTLLAGTGVSIWFALEAGDRATAEQQAREDLQDKQREATRLASEKSALADQQTQTIGQLEDNLYVARIREAQIALDAGDYDTTRRLLAMYVPPAGDPDRRCFAWRHLNYRLRRADPVVRELPDSGFAQEHGRLVLAPDGTHFAVCFGQHVTVGNYLTGAFERHMTGDRIADVCFTKDSRYVAVASGRAWGDDSGRAGKLEHHNVVLYDLQSPDKPAVRIPESPLRLKLTRPPGDSNTENPDAPGICVAGSPTQPLIACGLAGGRIAIWNYETGNRVAELAVADQTADEDVIDFVKLAFTPDGKKLVSARFAHAIDLWDVESAAHEAELYRFPARLQYRHQYFTEAFWLPDAAALAISPDGRTLAAAANGQNFVVIDLPSRDVRECIGHHDAITSLAFLADGKSLVSGSLDHDIRLWNIGNLREIAHIGSHRSPVHGVAVPPSGGEVLSVGSDNGLRRWKLPNSESAPDVMDTQNHVYALAFRPNSDELLVGGWPTLGGTTLWNTGTGDRYEMTGSDRGRVKGIDVSRNGNIAVSANLEGNCIDVWDPDRTLVRQIKTSVAAENVSLHPDGNIVVVSPFFEAPNSAVFDIQTGTQLQTIPGTSVFSPNGRWLATTFEGRLQLRDANTLQLVPTNGPDNVSRARFSRDSRLLALKDSPTSFLVWDVERQRVWFRADGHFSEVSDFAFAPDGRTVASVGKDLRVLLWDLRTGQLKGELIGHRGATRAICFNSEGTVLATGGVDHTVRLWRAPRDGQAFEPVRYEPANYAYDGSASHASTSPPDDGSASEQQALTHAINDDRNDWTAWARRAGFYRTHRRWIEAGRDFAKAVELHPNVGSQQDLLARAAVVALRAGMIDDYRDYCRQLLEFGPENPDPGARLLTLCLSPESGVDFESLFSNTAGRFDKVCGRDELNSMILLCVRTGRYEQAQELLSRESTEGDGRDVSPLRDLLKSMVGLALKDDVMTSQAGKAANSAYLKMRGVTVSDDDEILAFEVLSDEATRRHDLRITEELVATSQVPFVHRMAAELTDEERFNYLKSWVLPDRTSAVGEPIVRVYAAATNASSSAREQDLLPADRQQLERLDPTGTGSRLLIGGNLICPAVELIQTAKRLNRLDELVRAAATLETASEVNGVQHLAFLILVRLENQETEQANKLFDRLYSLSNVFFELDESDRWTLLATFDHLLTFASVRPFVALIAENLTKPGPHRYEQPWSALVARLRDKGLLMLDQTHPESGMGTPPKLRFWAQSAEPVHGEPRPTAHWHVTEAGELMHVGTHDLDDVYFAIPLSGNFAVDCELCGWRESELIYGGRTLMIGGQPVSSRQSDVGRSVIYKKTTIDPPLKLSHWYRYRLEVGDGTIRAFVNEQLIDEDSFEPDMNVWLGVRAWRGGRSAGVRNMRIFGNPVIPGSLHLSSGQDLHGWTDKEYGFKLAGPDAKWQIDEGTIIGLMVTRDRPGAAESTIQYHRPLMEDGVVEYEFLHEPGKVMTHFVLDRLVFLLRPSGISLHWMTDSNGGQPTSDVYREVTEVENRRGPNKLPLQQGWNRTRVELVDDIVSLFLNDTHVYEYKLERTNLRTFGFFHYRDQTEARIRNVVYRGAWPQTLTDEARNELAMDPVQTLAQSLDLPTTVEIDLSDQAALAANGVNGLEQDSVAVTSTGLQVRHPANATLKGHGVSFPYELEGDCEMTVTFDQLELPQLAAGRSMIHFTVNMEGPYAKDFGINCGLNIDGGRTVHTTRRDLTPDGTRHYRFSESKLLADRKGQLRIIRKGARIHCLQSAGDGSDFQHIASATMFDPESRITSLILGITHAEAGKPTSVVWKKLSIRSR